MKKMNFASVSCEIAVAVIFISAQKASVSTEEIPCAMP